MNAISFSLFGQDPIYLVGALKNCQLATDIYPGWKVVIWIDYTITPSTVNELKRLGADVRETPRDISNTMFGRFLIADDSNVERFIIRDTDSRLSPRERACVDEWIDSDMLFHVIGDHPHHWIPIGGGLWGAKRGAIEGSMHDLIVKSTLASGRYKREQSYSLDQIFLSQYVLPMARGKIFRHDSCTRHLYPWSSRIPGGCHFGDWSFIGEIINEHDEPNWNHRTQRVNHMTV